MIKIYNLETNCPSSGLTLSELNDCTFNSSAPNLFPSPFLASNFYSNNFIYNNYMIFNNGPGSEYWVIYDIEYGMNGLLRYGIGYFYFYSVIQSSIIPLVVEEDSFNLKLWDYLTTFWDYLKDDDRDLFENYWHGIYLGVNDLISKSVRLSNASAVGGVTDDLIENYYEIVLSPLTSKPLNPDPTSKGSNYIIRPVGKVLIEPEYDSSFNPIYRDVIEISAADYYKLRNVGLDCYVVVKVNKEGVADKYFKVHNLISSEEPNGRKQYAEIDVTQNIAADEFGHKVISDDVVGIIGIEGLYNLDDPSYVDISQYLVEIIMTGNPSSITWGADYLLIDAHIDNNIETILRLAPVTGTPWATLTNRSIKVKPAIFDYGDVGLNDKAVKFHNLSSYRNAEAPNGRYYPPLGNIWKWYDGYS